MTDDLNWFSYRRLAEALQRKYPDTDTLDLSDEELGEMLFGLDMTKSLPRLEEKDRKDVFFAVRVAWTRIIENDADYNAHADDAYV